MRGHYANRAQSIRRISSATLAALLVGAVPTRAETMTAGVVVKRMSPEQFSAYVAGIVEGLAHGSATPAARSCLYAWFYGTEQRLLQVGATFEHYAGHAPGDVVAAMVRKECGS